MQYLQMSVNPVKQIQIMNDTTHHHHHRIESLHWRRAAPTENSQDQHFAITSSVVAFQG